jgi:hypothetical protein
VAKAVIPKKYRNTGINGLKMTTKRQRDRRSRATRACPSTGRTSKPNDGATNRSLSLTSSLITASEKAGSTWAPTHRSRVTSLEAYGRAECEVDRRSSDRRGDVAMLVLPFRGER